MMKRLRTAGFIVPAIAFCAILAAWEAAAHIFRIPIYLFPAPSMIAADTSALGVGLVRHTLATLHTVIVGFVLSIVVSLPIAIALSSSSFLSRAIYPLLILSQSIPKVALAPILVVAFGANEIPRVIITFLVAFFPLVISSVTGLLSLPADLVEFSRSVRATRMQEFIRIRMPYALPHVFAGLKVAITLCVVGAVVGEFVAADRGLGYLITTSTAYFKTPVAFGAMILLAIIGIVLFELISALERWFVPWAPKVGQDIA